jgi:hypothetical protein
MFQQEPLKLFNGWATIHSTETPVPQSHIPDEEVLIEPRFSEPFVTFELALSKRPAEQIEVFSPTGRPIGDHYFRAHPYVHFDPLEITRIVCVLWRHAAIIRYHELWQAFTVEQFMRGYQGKVKLRVWLERVIRREAKREDLLALKPQPHAKWNLAQPQNAYPHIRRWSPQAITIARAFAWQFSQQRKKEEG